MSRFGIFLFFLLLPTLAFAQRQVIEAQPIGRLSGKLQEMPLLQPSAELQQKYPYREACLTGPFQDQGYWISCPLYTQENHDTTKESSFHWIGFAGCDQTNQNYEMVLTDQMPVSGMDHCQILLFHQLEKNQSGTSEELQLMNAQGKIVWSYPLPSLVGENFSIFEGQELGAANIHYRDMIVSDANGYLLLDGQNLVRLDQQGKVLWKKPLKQMQEIQNWPRAKIGFGRSQPQLLSGGDGLIYISLPMIPEPHEGRSQTLVFQINSASQQIKLVFDSGVVEETQYNSTQIEPIILANHELAILFLNNTLGLLKYDVKAGDWLMWWQENHDNGEILSTLQTPEGYFLLIDSSADFTFEDNYDESDRYEFDGVKFWSQTRDGKIKIIRLDGGGKYISADHFPLDLNLYIGPTMLPGESIGYLAYLPSEGVRVINNFLPFIYDWRSFQYKSYR